MKHWQKRIHSRHSCGVKKNKALGGLKRNGCCPHRGNNKGRAAARDKVSKGMYVTFQEQFKWHTHGMRAI